MKTVDIIVPVFNEEENLADFYRTVGSLTGQIPDYEFCFLFVNDGSSDQSLSIIKTMAQNDNRVKYVSFSRNFGKEAAIYAGLQHADADMVILMDADLQHPPELIPEMVRQVGTDECDACGAKREPRLSSHLFYWLNNKMSPVKLQNGATDYMCMNRKFVQAVLKLSETQRFSKGLFAWVGFRVTWIDYKQGPRTRGKSKWNIRKLISYAIDGITGFSVIPLKIVSFLGVMIFFIAVICIIYTIIRTLIHGIDVPGYVTTLTAVLFLGGIILMSLGIVGNYIGRIFIESKDRPLYITDETNLGKDVPEEESGSKTDE